MTLVLVLNEQEAEGAEREAERTGLKSLKKREGAVALLNAIDIVDAMAIYLPEYDTIICICFV